jgi:hypothetical protein
MAVDICYVHSRKLLATNSQQSSFVVPQLRRTRNMSCDTEFEDFPQFHRTLLLLLERNN